MMKRTLTGLTVLLASAGVAQAAAVGQRWGWKATRCTHPGTVKVVPGIVPRLVFDLSAIPRGATVHRASLHAATRDGVQPTDPIRIHSVERLEGEKPVHGDRALKLRPPWYRSFDATEAVRRWVKDPESNLGLALARFERFDPSKTFLDVVYDGKPAKPPPQVAAVRALHHQGQTFIVWAEQAEFRPKPDEVVWVRHWSERGDELADGPGSGEYGMPNHPAITLKTLRRLQGLGLRDKPSGFQGIKPLKRVREVPPVSYRVYRHGRRITAGNIHQAQLLAEVAPLSGFDKTIYRIHFKGEYIDQREEPTSPVPTYRVGGREALTPGEGLYVHTGRRRGKAYYAVTAVLAGTENLSDVADANSLAQPIDESPATPLPVLQFIQRDHYKPNVPERWHVFWAAPPYFNLPNAPFHVAAAVPDGLGPSAPMYIKAPHHGGFNVRGDITVPSSKAVTLQIDQHIPWGTDLCFSEGRGTLRSFTGSKVDFFSERQMLHLINWAADAWAVDRSRIGGSLFFFGLRHPEIFPKLSLGGYTVAYDMRWSPGSNSLPRLVGPKGAVKTIEGDDAWAVFSIEHYLKKYPARDIPFLFCFSSTGKDSGHTSEFGWQDDPRGWRALLDARQPFVAAWSCGNAGVSEMPAEMAAKFRDMDWNKSIPAFSNCSLDNNPGNGDPADGDYCGQINGWLLWGDADQTDKEQLWEMTVRLLGSCPRPACTVDITPRHCKAFKPKAGDEFAWGNVAAGEGRIVQSGRVKADEWGLVTLRNVKVTRDGNRIIIIAGQYLKLLEALAARAAK